MTNSIFSDNDLLRYSRHIFLPQIDMNGQETLSHASVLIIGCGGLGSSAAPILAAAGIGNLGLVDFDTVELSNLQRQISFNMQNLNSNKAIALKNHCLGINPSIKIIAYDTQLEATNVQELFLQYDYILDCSDHYTLRILINKHCLRLKKTLISGAAMQFEGQLSIYPFHQAIERESLPCYHCLFPQAPKNNHSCSASGIFSPVVHIIGAMQAQETIKSILKIGRSPSGHLLIYNALHLQWSQFTFNRNPHCPTCQNEFENDNFCKSS